MACLSTSNEELQTLNNELKLKLDAVSRAHNDLQNLMSATDVATLFLSTNLRINLFTPKLADISTGDEGRPISDFTHKLDYDDLAGDAKKVLADLAPIERTVGTEDSRNACAEAAQARPRRRRLPHACWPSPSPTILLRRTPSSTVALAPQMARSA